MVGPSLFQGPFFGPFFKEFSSRENDSKKGTRAHILLGIPRQSKNGMIGALGIPQDFPKEHG